MNCSFSGRPVPTDKLLVLYYPPAAAHETWDKSFFAAARAREALAAAREQLEAFFGRHVVTRGFVPGALAGLAGLGVLVTWLVMAVRGWGAMGVAGRYVMPLLAVVLIFVGQSRLRAFLERWRIWRGGCRATVARELAAVRTILDSLPEDPDAEEAATVMRRECPADFSEIAFQRSNFRAFTYLDFVLSPRLRHPADRAELPQAHSLYRDAYYVGEVVYDSWRMFQKDRRLTVDPRFVGSGGRRGVI